MLKYHLTIHLTPLQLVHALRAHSLTASNGANVSRDNCDKRNVIFNPITVDSAPQTFWETGGLDFPKTAKSSESCAPSWQRAMPPSPLQDSPWSLLSLPHLLPLLEQPSPAQLNPNPSSSTWDLVHGSLPGGKRQVII